MSNNLKEFGKDLADMSLNTTVKMGLSLIPVIGQTLAISYDEINNKIQYDRLISFISELEDAIKTLDETLYNKLISEEEYGIIVEKVLKSVKVETNSAKREYFKKLFISGLLLNDVKSYRVEIFTEILSALNVVDIKVLRLLYEKDSSVSISSITDPDFSKEELYGAINKLKSYGFVDINMSSMTIGGPQSQVRENVFLNEFGRTFLKYCFE